MTENVTGKLLRMALGIKVVITDLDGVLTDGGMYCNEEGLMFKKFNTRDAAAVHVLKDASIAVYVVTNASDELSRRRIASMSPTGAYFGIANKAQTVLQIAAKERVEALNMIYIGDDFVDLPAFNVAGLTMCPADANLSVKSCVDIVCEKKGGEGVLNEVADGLLITRSRIIAMQMAREGMVHAPVQKIDLSIINKNRQN